MKKATVHIFPWLTSLFGALNADSLIWEEEIGEGDTLRDLIQRIRQEYPALDAQVFSAGQVGGDVAIVLNGRLVATPQDWETPLGNGDTISFLPAFAGGGL